MSRARVFSAVLGFTLAVAGLLTENRYLVWAAMVVLAVALGLRLVAKRRAEAQRDHEA